MKEHGEHEHDHGKKSPRHLAPQGESQDSRRDHEDARHHTATHIEAHPPHHPQHHQQEVAQHHPHTAAPENVLNADHGTHEDRPRPGKLAKESKGPGKGKDRKYP